MAGFVARNRVTTAGYESEEEAHPLPRVLAGVLIPTEPVGKLGKRDRDREREREALGITLHSRG